MRRRPARAALGALLLATACQGPTVAGAGAQGCADDSDCPVDSTCRRGSCVDASADCTARESVCGDGSDNDCDAVVDCADPDCSGEACDDGLICTSGDSCLGGNCTGRVSCGSAPGPCTEATGSCSSDGSCTYALKPAGAACRAAVGSCDRAEVCDGIAATCPADVLEPATMLCRAATGVCDIAEYCTGSSTGCPEDLLEPATKPCRAATGVCDVAEYCTGSSTGCPEDLLEPATTVCRSVTGACDIAERCTGTATACPADALAPATTICRAASGACDMTESCDDISPSCPTDLFTAAGTTCSVCHTCNGAGGCAPVADGTDCGTGMLCLDGVCSNSTGTTYYVSCTGSDSRSGSSPSAAWATLSKASTAPLGPGDSLLLEKGCTFSGKLTAGWTGTASAPIRIGAYGTGDPPLISNDALSTKTSFTGVDISGSFQTIEELRVEVVNPYRDPGCLQADGTAIPLGWYLGFNVSGHHNTLRAVEGAHLSLGVDFDDTSSFNRVLDSYFHDLNYLWRLSATSGAMGAMGVNLHGDDNEIAFCRFERNGAQCNLTDGTLQRYSAPFEVYNANRSLVHHNQMFGHRKHFEMGHDTTHTTADNVFAYNLLVSDHPDAVGPNIHGSDNPYGPVDRTAIYNNTVVFTGANSQGITCGCSGGAIIRNNIFVAEWKAAYYKGDIVESNNVYWDLRQTSDTSADPFVQFNTVAPIQTSMSATSVSSDPRFVSGVVPGGDYHTLATSPAVNRGMILSTTDPDLLRVLSEDLDRGDAPQGGAYDSGVYERAP